VKAEEPANGPAPYLIEDVNRRNVKRVREGPKELNTKGRGSVLPDNVQDDVRQIHREQNSGISQGLGSAQDSRDQVHGHAKKYGKSQTVRKVVVIASASEGADS
jgi:hypothetical protein